MPNLRPTAVLLLSAALPFSANAQQGNLDKTIAQMDAASAKFQSAQANVRNDKYTRVIRDTETQNGTIYFQRVDGSSQMGMKIADAGTQKTLQYRNGVLDVFSPGVDQIEEFHNSQAEGFFSLGFGGKGSDLAKSWNITDLGSENITVDGKTVSTEKLDLVSKDPNIVKSYFTHIALWIDLTRDIALKQIFYQPNGDTQTSTYTNIRYNQKVDTAPFAIKRDARTKVLQH